MANAIPAADRAGAAKRIADQTKRRVRAIDAKTEVNRSTRARHVLKAKAEAFDRIADALAGRT